MSALIGGLGALRAGGGAGSPTFLWELVADFNFALEADQALGGGNLTVTNRVDGSPVVLAGQTVAITSGALVMTAPASSNLAVASKTTRTAALLGAAMTTIWPDFDGQPIRWGAEVSAAPTFDVSTRAWGVFAENETGLGGGNAGLGFTAEVRSTGVGTATRYTRYQFSGGSSSVVALNSTAYAAGLVAGIGLEGNGARGFWSLNPGDAGELDVLTQVGAVGAPGGSEAGTAIAGVSQLGVFAAASTTGAFVVSVERLVLWARVARVAS